MKCLRARVRVNSEMTDPFEVKVGVHQGSALLPLLFITVMDVQSERASANID